MIQQIIEVDRMPPRRATHGECREHERQWREYCVDRNLQDDWLERLNQLQVLRLINICEGHHDLQTDPSRKSPHFILQLKDEYLPSVAKSWDRHKMAILEQASRSFQSGDTTGSLELKFRLRWRGGRLAYQEDLVVRIRCQRKRTSMEMDEQTRAWFEQNVDWVEGLDRSIASLWEMVDP
jgi:hypothetical protein